MSRKRPPGSFTYTLLPLPPSSSWFSPFARSSEFRLCFSLINGATQVAHSGLHPARASLRAVSWRQQRLCCILTAFVSPWVKTDETCLVYNLDARLSAFRRFLSEEKRNKEKAPRKTEKRKWRTCGPVEKCFGLRGESVIGGLGGSLHCMSRRIIAGGSALLGDCGPSEQVISFFKADWTPSTNCRNTTFTMGELLLLLVLGWGGLLAHFAAVTNQFPANFGCSLPGLNPIHTLCRPYVGLFLVLIS